MTFPRRTDVSRHVRRRSKPVSKLPVETSPLDDVPMTDLQLLAARPVGTSAFLTESATPKPALTPEDVPTVLSDLGSHVTPVRE